MASASSGCSGVVVDFDEEAPGKRVQAALAASPLMALRQLMAEQTDGRIHISGSVSSFYQKQQAQELVRAKAPGLIVVNEVEVS